MTEWRRDLADLATASNAALALHDDGSSSEDECFISAMRSVARNPGRHDELAAAGVADGVKTEHAASRTLMLAPPTSILLASTSVHEPKASRLTLR